ncbi:MAG: tetratricopeptide repeat protein [Acidobacteria bacterium]|nr:tetratricopeptide repeat protein [Acidobacteriota bacterium]
MERIAGLLKGKLTLSIVLSVIAGATLVAAQSEIVPVRDILRGTNVFVFPSGTRTVSKKYVTQAKAKRTQQQRAATAQRVNRQYTTIAKTNPRRKRTDAVNPDSVAKIDLKVIPPAEASRIFAGLGEYHIDRGEYDNAIDIFRDALNLDAKNEAARGGLSEALALKGNELLASNTDTTSPQRFSVAQRFFEEAVKINPLNAPALFGLAEILSDTGRETDAIGYYENALKADKDLTEIYVPLGILYYQQGNIAKASEFLSKAGGISKDDPQGQYFLGLVRLQQNDLNAAALNFDAARKADPSMEEANYYHGEVQMRMGNTSAAVKDFEKATQLKDDYFEAWYGLGTANFELAGRAKSDNDTKKYYEEAMKAFEKAKTLRNTNAEVTANLGDVYRQLGDFNKAETNYNLATVFFERQPDFNTDKETRDLVADINVRLAFVVGRQCEINMERGVACKWPRAIRALERSLELKQDNITLANLGWAYYRSARVDMADRREAAAKEKLTKARDMLVKASSSGSGYDQGVLLNLGMVSTDLGDHPGAVKALTQVVAREPKWTFAINELGMAYFNSGDMKQAIEQFKRAVKEDDKYADAYYNLGQAEFKNGNVKEAQKAYDKLKSLKRNDLADRLRVTTRGAVKG